MGTSLINFTKPKLYLLGSITQLNRGASSFNQQHHATRELKTFLSECFFILIVQASWRSLVIPLNKRWYYLYTSS